MGNHPLPSVPLDGGCDEKKLEKVCCANPSFLSSDFEKYKDLLTNELPRSKEEREEFGEIENGKGIEVEKGIEIEEREGESGTESGVKKRKRVLHQETNHSTSTSSEENQTKQMRHTREGFCLFFD